MNMPCRSLLGEVQMPAGSPPETGRLLILDPLERLAPVLGRDLERSGYSVAAAPRWQAPPESGPAGPEAGAPWAVLSDGLPGSEIEKGLAAEIAASCPSNPPPLIAVVAEEGAGIEWMAAGASYMIEFPVQPALLRVVVGRALEIHRARRADLRRRERQAKILRGFGHDLRNLVNAILGCVQLIETDESAPAPPGEDLAMIRRNTRSIIDLTERLLEEFQDGEGENRTGHHQGPVECGHSRTVEKLKK